MSKHNKTIEELNAYNEQSRFEEHNPFADLNEHEKKAIDHIRSRKQMSLFYIDPEILNKEYDYSWRPLTVRGKLGDKLAEENKQEAWIAVSPDEIPSLMEGLLTDHMGREIPKDYIRRGECALFKRKKIIGETERAILRQEVAERMEVVNSNGDAMMSPHLRTGVVLQGQRFVGSDAQFANTSQQSSSQYGQRGALGPVGY